MNIPICIFTVSNVWLSKMTADGKTGTVIPLHDEQKPGTYRGALRLAKISMSLPAGLISGRGRFAREGGDYTALPELWGASIFFRNDLRKKSGQNFFRNIVSDFSARKDFLKKLHKKF
jgi:hypothetical protein